MSELVTKTVRHDDPENWDDPDNVGVVEEYMSDYCGLDIEVELSERAGDYRHGSQAEGARRYHMWEDTNGTYWSDIWFVDTFKGYEHCKKCGRNYDPREGCRCK